MYKKILLFLLVILTAASAASAETIKFGTSAEYRPFVYYNSSYDIIGMDIDIITEIGKREGFTIQVLDMAFDGLIDSASVGQIDLIGGGYSVTDERKAELLFSDVYYENKTVLIALKAGSLPNSLTINDLKDKRIAVQRGSSFDQWLKTNLVSEGLLSPRNIYTFSTTTGEIKALQNGTVDLVMLDEDTYQQTYAEMGLYKIVNDDIAEESYAFAAAPGSEELIARINHGLQQMKADGTLDSLISKYTQTIGEDAEFTIARPSQIGTTPVLSPTPTPIPPVDQPVNCKNVMVFMSDVSYPDGTKVNPGTEFTKTWRIYNNGSCKWYEGYTIEYTGGEYLSGNSTVIPTLTIPGTTVDVSITLKAPQATGDYTSYFQLRAPDGSFFGPKLTARIIVTDQAVSAPPVGAPPVITRWQPNYNKGDNSFCPTVYWTVRDATAIHFSINQKRIYSTTTPSGSMVICPRGGKGDYVYGIVAEGTKTVSYVFTYTNTGGKAAQPNIPLKENN